jgi:hypothetical protein
MARNRRNRHACNRVSSEHSSSGCPAVARAIGPSLSSASQAPPRRACRAPARFPARARRITRPGRQSKSQRSRSAATPTRRPRLADRSSVTGRGLSAMRPSCYCNDGEPFFFSLSAIGTTIGGGSDLSRLDCSARTLAARGGRRSPCAGMTATDRRLASVHGDSRCRSCGYGVAVAAPLPVCPMCGRSDWIGGRRPATAAVPSGGGLRALRRPLTNAGR